MSVLVCHFVQNEYVTTGTLLHLLAFVGRHEAVKWLLDSGAYPHTLNHTGSTPLHVAAIRHQPEVIKALRLHHADAYTENKVGGEYSILIWMCVLESTSQIPSTTAHLLIVSH